MLIQDIHRGKLPWELAEDKEDVTTVQGNIFQTLDRLEKIADREITFDKDADVYTYDVHDDSILCVSRNIKGKFFGIFNFSNQEKTAWMQEKGMYRNLLTGEKTELKDIRLSGYEFLLVWKLKLCVFPFIYLYIFHFLLSLIPVKLLYNEE